MKKNNPWIESLPKTYRYIYILLHPLSSEDVLNNVQKKNILNKIKGIKIKGIKHDGL